MAVEQAPKKETAQLARSHGPRKKKDAAGSAQPSTAFVPKGPPKPPEDHSVPGVKKDPMPANGYLAEDKEHHATEVAKQQPKTNGLPPAVKAAMDNVRAITETEVLIATMSSVGDKNGRWKFLNTLDRIDDPGVRAMVREKFEQRTHQSLDTFIKNAHWYSKRDREQAEDMVGENRKHAEEQNAADAAAKPEEYAKKKNQAIAWAAAVLQVTRKDDPDSDSEAKAIFDTLGPRSPEEIEMIRAEIRRQTGGRTAYQEMDKSLSGGTEDEAVAGLKGNPINAVKEGIKNADGNSKRIQELLGRLDDKQLLQLNCENPMLAGFAINSVADDQKATIGALMKGDRAHANAEHIADLFKDPMDGAQLEGPMMSKQTQANIENRKPENIINELRAMSPDAIHAAREAWNKEHGDGAWDEMVTKRFKGDDHMLMRMRSLADGNKMEERAYALRQGMAEHNQKLIEDAISNPDLENDQDPAKKAIALTQRAELEARVMTLELNADRAAAQMTGKDPNAVVPETMQQQLDGYYKEYGAKAPQPKDYDEMLSYVSDKDAYQKKHEKKNDANKLATGEIETHGDVSTVTKIIRAEEKNDQQTKSQLLENLKSNDERDKVAEQYAARNEGKSIYEDPRKGDFAAMANYKKEVLGDDRPLSEIQQEIADESRNSNQNRIHNVQTYGVKAARTPEIELKLQTEQLKLQHSDSLENSEIMREYMGGNIGTEDLAKHQLENMKDQVESTTHWDDASLAEFKARDKAMTSTLELQREEKIKHAERLARAFSTIAKIGALLIGQPELVFLIDAVAGLTEMAIKSSAMGNDYDPALDEKMFALTMTVDALTLGMGKYFKGAASKIDDVVAAEQTGVKTATEVTEQAVTGEAKKELTEDAVKQVVKTEAGVASGVAKTTENVAEGGATTIAKAESAVAKAEAQVAETTVENTAADAAKKSLARQELAGNILLGAGNTIAAGEIQGESSGDIATGVLRGIFGTLIPAKLGDKIDDIFGKGKLGSVIKFGTNVASDVAVGGNSVDMALAGATGNHWQAKRAEAQHKGAAPVEEHPLAYHAEEPTTPRPVVNEESHVTKPLPSESVDPNVLAHGHNAEADHLVTSTVADESHTTKPVVEEPTRTGAKDGEPTTRADVDEAQTRLSDRTGSTENGVLGVSSDPTDHRRTQHSENVSERANARRDQMDLETRTLHDQQFALAENPGQQAVLERAVAAGRSVEDVKKLRMAMTGMSEADAIQYFSGSGLIQYYHQSCVPTAYQIALAEVDPMFALHLRNNPGEMMQKQRDVLIADGAAQQPRIADNNNGSTYKEHANDPETARILSEEARYSDKGDSRGIDVGSMKDQQLHKDLEAATGTPYEIMKKRGEATKLDSVPVDRIVQAAAENKPVMYSMFGHEYVVVGSSVGADGKPVLHVQDPMSGKVSDVMPDVLGMMKVESVTLPGAATATSGGEARTGSVEPRSRSADGDSTIVGAQDRTASLNGGTDAGPHVSLQSGDSEYRQANNAQRTIDRANQRLSGMDADARAQYEGLLATSQNRAHEVLLERALAAGASIEDIQQLHAAMQSMGEAEALKAFSGAGLVQLYEHSCVPTADQIALAELNPVAAMKMRNAPADMLMRTQEGVLANTNGRREPRSDLAQPPEALAALEQAPELASALRDDSRYHAEGNPGMDPTLMKDQPLRQELEAAAGVKYEAITNSEYAYQNPDGNFTSDQIPHDRIGRALDSQLPVTFGADRHERTIIGRQTGNRGEIYYLIEDPKTGRTTRMAAHMFGAFDAVTNLSLPAEGASANGAVHGRNGADPEVNGGRSSLYTEEVDEEVTSSYGDEDVVLPLPQTGTSELDPQTIDSLGESELVHYERQGRPTPPESESRAENVELDGFDFRAQVSTIGNEEVGYGTKGSTRPDAYSETLRMSVDVKNYDLSSDDGRDRLINDVVKQAARRGPLLPDGTRQAILIDVRGQDVSESDMEHLRIEISSGSAWAIEPDNIQFITDKADE